MKAIPTSSYALTRYIIGILGLVIGVPELPPPGNR